MIYLNMKLTTTTIDCAHTEEPETWLNNSEHDDNDHSTYQLEQKLQHGRSTEFNFQSSADENQSGIQETNCKLHSSIIGDVNSVVSSNRLSNARNMEMRTNMFGQSHLGNLS